jgi:acetyl esterase/lipase
MRVTVFCERALIRPIGLLLCLGLCAGVPRVAHAQDTLAADKPDKHFYLNENGDSLSAYVFRARHDSAGPTGAVVLFHGGGWTIGEPSWAFSRAWHLASLGMVAVAAEYRLSNKNGITPIDAMADVRRVRMMDYRVP